MLFLFLRYLKLFSHLDVLSISHLVWVSRLLCTFHHILLVSRVPVPSWLGQFYRLSQNKKVKSGTVT